MRKLAVVAFILGGFSAHGTSPELGGEPRTTRIGFPWFVAPQIEHHTAFLELPERLRVWLGDAAREEQKERAYWAKQREQEQRRISDRYRIETTVALQRALAALAARRQAAAAQSASLQDPEGSKRRGFAADTATDSGGQRPETPLILQQARRAATLLKNETNKIIGGLDRAADAIVANPQSSPMSRPLRDSGTVFFLLLLALFLVPSFAVAMLLLGFIHLRNGHRLQGTIFGLVGGTVMALLAVSVMDMRHASSDGQESVAVARRHAECKRSEVLLSGFVHDITSQGVVLANVTGAASDEHGWVLVVTSRNRERSGNKWTLPAYPVGTRLAPNTIGQIQPIPVYADTVEEAVALQMEAEKNAQAWWWQRMLRAIREA